MGRATALTAVSLALLIGASSCKGKERQLLVIVDTDLALPAHRDRDPTISPAAMIDHVRVDMLPEIPLSDLRGDPETERDFPLTAATAWPLSFAVRVGDLDETVARMRIRGFRSDSVNRNEDLSQSFVGFRPLPDLAVDRFVVVSLPAGAEVKTIRILLAGDCLGVESNVPERTNCITNPSEMQSAEEGIEPGDLTSVAGTWSGLRREACSLPAPAGKDAVCESGGLTIRGDANFEDVDTSADQLSSTPRHFVKLRAFHIDRREVTVGRFRAFVAKGTISTAQLPDEKSATNPACTWSATPGPDEERPINCIPYRTARAFCKEEGGDLPTDAQWEHAARGTRLGGSHVWGDADAQCCAARMATSSGCPGGPMPAVVASHADPARCEGRADLTPEGVVDLAGNVREMVQDAPEDYSSKKCPRRPISSDPACAPDGDDHSARGGSWRLSFDRAKIGMRTHARISDDLGFRCVYPGAP